MLPYLIAALVGAVVALALIYASVRYREFRKFMAGVLFLSSLMHFYFYLSKIPLPFLWIDANLQPVWSGVRGLFHFVLFLAYVYFGWFFRREPRAKGPIPDR